MDNESIKNNGVSDESATTAFKKDNIGMDLWARQLRERGLIGPAVYDDFMLQNSEKETRMEEFGLPHLNNYGLVTSTADINTVAARIQAKPEDLFSLRCRKKNTNEPKSLVGKNIDALCRYLDALPDGPDSWIVELKEYRPTVASGTIVVGPSAYTSIEMWQGEHYKSLKPGWPKYSGIYDPIVRHFTWESPEKTTEQTKEEKEAKEISLAQIQEYSIRALRYIFPNVEPRLNNPIYLEFCVEPSGEIHFIDMNTSPVMTGQLKPEDQK